MASGKNPMKMTVESGFPARQGAMAAASGLRFFPGYLDRARQEALLAEVAPDFCRGTAVYATHAAVGPAVYGAHVELRAARLGLR